MQAALGFGRPGAGGGLCPEAVPHVVAGLEGAQSLLLAQEVLITGSVPAADRRVRGEALHVCDHSWLRPNPPSPALACSMQDLSPPQLLLLGV